MNTTLVMAVREWCGGEQFDPGFVDLDQINEDLLEREALFGGTEPEFAPHASDFLGLSPNQVHELLQSPLNCPSVFRPLFDAEIVSRELDTAPVFRMAKALMAEMGEKGVRLTGKGNLPLKHVKAMIEAGGEAIYSPCQNTAQCALRSMCWASTSRAYKWKLPATASDEQQARWALASLYRRRFANKKARFGKPNRAFL
ncbi:MAG: hypothetical protein ACI92N_003538 [Pseudomonadales bacterium]|jgi:hypothetical protein